MSVPARAGMPAATSCTASSVDTGAKRPFLGTLRAIERELTIPIPERTRMLRELEFDLEALGSRFVAEGMPLEEAMARAVEALVPDQETLRALKWVHQPLYLRLTRGWGDERLRSLERAALALATLAVVLTGTGALMRADLLADPSRFLWIVLGLGGAIVALCGWKAHQLWIRRDHRRPGGGLALLAGLIATTVFAGVFGALWDTYEVASLIEGVPAREDPLVLAWVMRESALLSVSILIAMTGALALFVFRQWLAVVGAEHREALGHPGNHSSEGARS